MQPPDASSTPRHRGIDVAGPAHSLDPGSVVYSPNPGRYPRHAPDPWLNEQVVADQGIGFRSTRDVSAEMSPVIYRPAGSGGDRDPEEPARVSIAGPGVPTAASFADGAAPPQADDLDDDPEIDDDELASEADDTMIDDPDKDVDAAAQPAESTPDAFDDDLDYVRGEGATDGDVTTVKPPRRPGPVQRRRRRILRRSHDEVEPESPPEREPMASAEPLPTAPQPPAPEPASPAPRPRRVRTLHIGSPPVGPASEDAAETSRVAEPVVEAPIPEDPEPKVSADDEPVAAEPGAEETATDEPAAANPVAEVPDGAPDPDPRWRKAAPPRLGGPTQRTNVSEPADDDSADDQPQPQEPLASESEPETSPEPGQTAETDVALDDTVDHARVTGAISGQVISTRGRGLSGVSIVAIDPAENVVGTATTGRRGEFVIDDLSHGVYRIGARDTLDGDFIDHWHGGEDPDTATELILDEDHTLRDIDITLVGRVTIDADVDIRRKNVLLDIEVIDRSTGLPSEGTVIIETGHFRTRLPLSIGRTSITLFGTPDEWSSGGEGLDPNVSIEYVGSRHTAGATRTIYLR